MFFELFSQLLAFIGQSTIQFHWSEKKCCFFSGSDEEKCSVDCETQVIPKKIKIKMRY